MAITYDPEKRRQTIERRELDFEDASQLFAGLHYTKPADRDYGEDRQISVGVIGDDIIVIVWTLRGGTQRIISMRKADRHERTYYREWLDRS